MAPPMIGIGIVDHHACRDSAEELEGASVAGKPRLDLLVRHDLGILVGEDVLYRGTTPEVHLRHVARIEFQHGGDVGMRVFELLEKTTDGRIRAGIAIGIHQRLVDGGTPYTLTPPGCDLVLVG